MSGKVCPVCGGSLHSDEATIPYIFDGDVVIVVKKGPATICGDCRAPFTIGEVTDRITDMIRQLRSSRSEVSVITYSEYEPV